MKTKNKRIIIWRIISLIMLIATCIIIFLFSAQNGEQSSGISRGTIYHIIQIFTKDENEIKYWIYVLEPTIRKLAHFTIYTILGICAMSFNSTFNIKDTKKIGISAIIGCIYACTDEFHQSFLDARTASICDVMIDTLGATFGAMLVMLCIQLLKKQNGK